MAVKVRATMSAHEYCEFIEGVYSRLEGLVADADLGPTVEEAEIECRTCSTVWLMGGAHEGERPVWQRKGTEFWVGKPNVSGRSDWSYPDEGALFFDSIDALFFDSIDALVTYLELTQG